MPNRLTEVSGRTVHTTTITFARLSPRRRARAESVAVDVCWLLAFATMSPVRPFRFAFGNTSRGLTTTQRAQSFIPTIALATELQVRDFLLATWTQYRRLARSRKLRRVIDYLVISEHPDQPIEVRTLLLLTALESLKSTHSPGRRGDFERRVRTMLLQVGLRPGLKLLVKLRNRLIHEGLAGVPYSSLSSHQARLHDLLREYLLRLLGYQGCFLLYSQSGRGFGHI